jgi:hypothetical protein
MMEIAATARDFGQLFAGLKVVCTLSHAVLKSPMASCVAQQENIGQHYASHLSWPEKYVQAPQRPRNRCIRRFQPEVSFTWWGFRGRCALARSQSIIDSQLLGAAKPSNPLERPTH